MQLVDRLVAAINDTMEKDGVKRDALLIVGSPDAVEILKREPGARSLWIERIQEADLHPSIAGHFALVRCAAVDLPALHKRAFIVTSGRQTCAVIAGW